MQLDKGLLKPEREKRLTAEQALTLLSQNVEQKTPSTELSERMSSLSLENKTYQPQFKEKNRSKEKVPKGVAYDKLRKIYKKSVH